MNELNSQRLQYLNENAWRTSDQMDNFNWSQSYSNRVRHQDKFKTVSAWVESASKESGSDTSRKTKETISKWIVNKKKENRIPLLVAFVCIALLLIISFILVLLFALSKFFK
jgi:hypothetical protein